MQTPPEWSAWEITKLAVPPLIVAVGWGITHLLALRAQRLTLRNQVVDRARLDIVKELRSYQHYTSRISTQLMSVLAAFGAENRGYDPHWSERADLLLEHLDAHRAHNEWSLRLEEYEILFPETRDVRVALVLRTARAAHMVSTVHQHLVRWSLGTSTGAENDARKAFCDKTWGELQDLSALFEDLIIYLQNASLGPITGNAIPPRVPGEAETERIERDERSGQLVIRKTSEHDPRLMDEFKNPPQF